MFKSNISGVIRRRCPSCLRTFVSRMFGKLKVECFFFFPKFVSWVWWIVKLACPAPLAKYALKHYRNTTQRQALRTLFVCLSMVCICICMLPRRLQHKQQHHKKKIIVYVLDPGYPITRISEIPSSHANTTTTRLLQTSSLKIEPTVSWHSFQMWEPIHKQSDDRRNFRYPSCRRLLTGEPEGKEDAQNFMASNFPLERTDHDYIRETKNCARFVQERGYILDASQKEKEFPIAFSLLFYKDIEQAERLLRAVYRPHNVYCLHLDVKSPPTTWRALRGLTSCLDNVFISSRSVDVQWGTFTVLEPELICMQDLWSAHKSWRYFINLTGQEFPLKTNLQLVDILTAFNGSNDIDGTTSKWWTNRWNKVLPAPHAIQPVKGNLHITATRGFVDYLLHSDVAQDFLVWVNKTEFPDETFFSSLNHNPHLQVPGSYLGPPDTDAGSKPYLSRYKNWGHNWDDRLHRTIFNWPCHGKRVRMLCIFGVGDLPFLTARKELFANKLHMDYQPLTLDCLEEWLWNTTMDEYSGRIQFDASFYRNLAVSKNHVDYHGVY